MIYWKYLMACKFIWVESCFGWKIILHIGKWVKCHWLLKNDLKTSTYDIWFLCILFVSFFWFLKQFWAIYEFSWFYSFYFWILIVTCSYESLEGFHARFEFFLDFYMSNDTNSKLKLWKLAKFWADWILVVRTVRG